MHLHRTPPPSLLLTLTLTLTLNPSRYATPDRLAVSSLTPPETLPLVLDNSAF